MPKALKIQGQRFGNLLILDRHPENKYGKSRWICQCDCGNQTVCTGSDLINGKIISCGCYALQIRSLHNKSKTKEYSIWINMKRRCFDPKNTGYQYYGAKGITVCDRWLGKKGFINFLSDMGECPTPNHSIDRINVNGNYCPENTRWATLEEQARNRTDNRFITYKGKTQTLVEWTEELGIRFATLAGRLNKGWSVEKTFETPVKHRDQNIT